MMELAVVLSIIAILSAMAVPSYLYKVIREQIESAINLAGIAEKPVEAVWTLGNSLPANNEAAGLPTPDKIVNYVVSSIELRDGAVNITFGNRANGALKGKILSLRPAVVTNVHMVPITWVCGNAEAPDKMQILGTNQTNLPDNLLPIACKPRSKK